MNFKDLIIPNKRELQVMLRREPEPTANMNLSSWYLNEINGMMLIHNMWYIEVFP
jgi:hypothetical protein